jgi:hypothetical protein
MDIKPKNGPYSRKGAKVAKKFKYTPWFSFAFFASFARNRLFQVNVSRIAGTAPPRLSLPPSTFQGTFTRISGRIVPVFRIRCNSRAQNDFLPTGRL